MPLQKAEEFYSSQSALLDQIRELLKNPKDLLKGITGTLEDNHELKKQLAEFEKIRLVQLRDELTKSIKEINGTNVRVSGPKGTLEQRLTASGK